jgi:hypothetical protein
MTVVFRPIHMDVSSTKMCLDISIFVKGIISRSSGGVTIGSSRVGRPGSDFANHRPPLNRFFFWLKKMWNTLSHQPDLIPLYL